MSTTICEICSNMGGAYKALDKPGKWIHSLCSSWIPEIYSVDVKGSPTLTINRLDKKRFRLRCVLCTGKGACIQCSYGKCCIPAHPWCVLHNPKGFTRRVIRDEDDEIVWDIFCKAHATAVSEPLKPKNKSKSITLPTATVSQGVASVQEVAEERERERERQRDRGYRGAQRGGGRKDSKPQYSMAHSVRRMVVHSNQLNGSMNSQHNSNLVKKDRQRHNLKKEGHLKDSEDDDTEDDDDTEEDDDEDERERNIVGGSKELKTRLGSKIDLKLRSSSLPSLHSSTLQSSFPILTLNEWPGQSEGEAMDLDHFWNVAAMQYPEDHSAEVL